MGMNDVERVLLRYTPLGIRTRDGVLCLPPAIALEFLDAVPVDGVCLRAVMPWFVGDADQPPLVPDIGTFLDLGDDLSENGTPQACLQRAKLFIREELCAPTDFVSFTFVPIATDPSTSTRAC
jgi:hypothetical protein